MDADRAALNRLPRWLLPALAMVPVAGVALFFVLPVGTLVARVVHPHSIGNALGAPDIAGVLWFTLWQAAVSTVLTLVVGFAPAYVLARYRFPGRRVALAAVTVPFMLPTVVVGAAFLALAPSWHDSVKAIVVAHVFFNVAVVVRVVGGMWAMLPTDLTAAARTLGASPSQVLRHVVLPLLRPSLWAAATVVFLFTFTSFGVVRVLGGTANPTLEVEIARHATQLGDVDTAAVLSMLQLLLLGVVVWWSARWQRRTATTFRGTPVARRARTARERRSVGLVVVITIGAMLTPVVALAARSVRLGGQWTFEAWRTLGDTQVRPGIGLGVDPLGSLTASLRIAIVATFISAFAGGAAALVIAAARRHGRLLDIGLMLPLGTSAVTIGLGLLITFDRPPFDWRASWWIVPVGHALVATPFVIRSVLPALRSVHADQRSAALTLGATPWRAWWETEVRRIARPLAVGAGFAAAISLGEFGATTFLSRSGNDTAPLAIEKLLARTGDIPRAQGFALATMLLVTCAAIVMLVDGRQNGPNDARRS
ncbi:MAG: iron ABC transporter permease [Actinomycetota bacterium]